VFLSWNLETNNAALKPRCFVVTVKHTLIAKRKIPALTFADSENNYDLNPTSAAQTLRQGPHIRIGCAKNAAVH
jgi:hypothetical protein